MRMLPLAFTTSLLAATSGSAPAATQLITTKNIDVTVKASKPKKNSFTFLSKDKIVDPGANAPTSVGATLRVADSAGQRWQVSLPAAGWKRTGKKKSIYTYKDRKQQLGPCKRVVLKANKRLKATCKGTGVTLVPPLTGPIEVFLEMGDQGYCAAAEGGTVKKNDTGHFRAKGAQAPAQCGVGATTTTTLPPAVTTSTMVAPTTSTSTTTTLPLPKRVFSTSSKHAGNLGGLTGADAICQTLASGAGLAGTFLAWLSDSTQSPSTRFVQAPTAYVRTDGATVADNWADLTDGTLQNPISLDENAAAATGIVWTNTDPDGSATSPSDHCMDWSSNDPMAPNGRIGQAADSDTTWTAWGTLNCVNVARLYCVEQ
jgi:hypothetical protein